MKNIDTEHIRLNRDGTLAGLFTVDLHKGKLAKGNGTDDPYWNVITQIIEAYSRIHQNEMYLHLTETKAEKAMNANKHGSSKTKMRRLISLPVGLMFDIEEFDPVFFGDKTKVRKFAKRYPGFAVVDVI